MGIFDKKKSISRQELKSALRKDSGAIPGTGGKKYYQRDRERIFREVFKPGYGSEISKNDWRRATAKLKSAERSVKTSREKTEIKREIRYLKEKAGKNI